MSFFNGKKKIAIGFGFAICCLAIGTVAYFWKTSSNNKHFIDNAPRPIANFEMIELKVNDIPVHPNSAKPSVAKLSTTKIAVHFRRISGKSPRGTGTVKLMQRGDDGAEVVQSTSFKLSWRSDKTMILSFELKVPKHAKNGDSVLRIRDIDVNLFEFPVLITEAK